VFVGLVALALVSSVAGGLQRAGAGLPVAWPAEVWPRALIAHAFLMVSAFMGTVIGVERAVAVKRPWAFAAPGLSGASGLVMLTGASTTAAWLAVLAALVFVGVNLRVRRLQREAHTALLLMGALAWAVGNGLHALQASRDAVIAWWFAFLVLTIAAERLEMTRLMRRRPGAAEALCALLAGLLSGAAVAVFMPAGLVVFGLSLTGLAVWLLSFDIARRTVRAQGLSRYMAVCLLLGYVWLGVAGVGWAALGLGAPPGVAVRDLALHALGLGFVLSMMLAHAPVILPAVARVKVLYGPWFYAPLALLHGSLVWRLWAPGGLTQGATGNALAMALFALVIAGSAFAWRRLHGGPAAASTRRSGRA
jgi:hypothetical protein